MDVLDGVYVNADGNIFSKIGKGFVKKDDSGKSKLTTGGKVAAGALAIGLTALTASKMKKKQPDQLNEEPYDTAMPVGGIKPVVEPPQPGAGAPSEKEKKNKTMIYVGIGVGALVVIGLIIYATKK